MATTAKAVEIAQYIKAEIALRLPALTVTLSFDTDQNPLVLVGAASTAAPGGLYKVMPVSWPLAKDSLGNTAYTVGPHVVMLATEANYAATTDNVVDVNTTSIQLQLIATGVSRGARFEHWNSANGTAPTASTFGTASNLKGIFEPSVQYPLVSNQ